MKRYGCVTALLVLGGLVSAVACSSDDDDVQFGKTGGAPGTGNQGGGGAGGAATVGPLVLVSRTPAPGDENAWALGPFELTFSLPLDEQTLEDAIRVQVGGADVPRTLVLDDTKTRVGVELDALPALPASLAVSVGPDLKSTSGKEFAGDAWTFAYPFWQKPSGTLPAAAGSAPGLAFGVDAERRVLVVLPGEAGLQAVRQEEGAWQALPAPPSTDDGASPLGGAFDAEGGFVLVWQEGVTVRSVHAARFADDEWSELGGQIVSGSSAASVAFGDSGAEVAVQVGNEVEIYSRSGGAWSAGPAFTIPAGGATEPELAFALDAAGDPQIAVVNAQGDLVTAALDGAVWSTLGTVNRARASGPVEPQLVVHAGTPVLAYLDGDAVSTNVQVAKLDGGVEPLGAALDVELDAQATSPRLGVDPQGNLVALWREAWAGKDRLYAARLVEQGFRVLGFPVATSAKDARSVRLGFDADGNVHAAWLVGSDDAALHVSRYNGSPVLPRGLASAGSRGACAIPLDSVGAAFPQTLTVTGCYTDVPGRKVVSAAIPFSLNSALWSDAALKKRYVLLPEGGTVDYVSQGALGMPVGTIIIKEFYVERTQGDPASAVVAETRFLVKRLADDDDMDAWQGYSYQWNDDATEGTLLVGAATVEKTFNVMSKSGAPATHTHTYPSRLDCLVCHNAPSGRVLGLQAVQLNRSQEYAKGVIDNQLRAWVAAGYFGDTAPAEEPEALARLTSPPDVGRSLEERSRSYFHANCAHCHRPGGSRPTIDFRYFSDLGTSGVCNFLTPGQHLASKIWQNDAHRGDKDLGPDTVDPADDVTQMPPLATLVKDDRQLAVTSAWIDSMSACP